MVPRHSGQRTSAISRSEIIGSKRRTSVKSASSRSARRSQLYSATAVRAACPSQRAERRVVGQAADARGQGVRIAGVTSSALTSSVRISRIAGRFEATMALPAAMYSNSLSGEVECVEMADAGFGSTRMSACASRPATSEGADVR